jgi:hypothetical protein
MTHRAIYQLSLPIDLHHRLDGDGVDASYSKRRSSPEDIPSKCPSLITKILMEVSHEKVGYHRGNAY